MCVIELSVFFFKQKTAYEMRISDWSSDVCSSDLARFARATGRGAAMAAAGLMASGAALAEPLQSIGEGEGEVAIVAWPGYIERGETDKAYDWEIGRASCRERVCQYV